ncbi:MAG TPA: bifunctional serine/threonine-protein kinase/formylglycine-generating enzyme family protein [Gemmataceae bacterium]|nr:bifunctional serine/threonine-protein kinase/formylglycine-generating enzyme family protein [Gemmataceae bacterium]
MVTLHPPASQPPTKPAPSPVGSGAPNVIHGYRLLQRLGGGTFGVVYKALSSGGVEAAVKVIQYSLGHPQAQRELEALELIKGLRHPYLLALHDFWIENDRLYMAMALADGTLADLIVAAGPKGMAPADVLPLFEQTAQALDFLHQHHVLHRDIKPANILTLAGFAAVADLGLAKFNPTDVATSQNFAGTAAYMAPETFQNQFRPATDQYALALCYAEARLGRQLCEGSHLMAAMHWQIMAKPELTGLLPHEEQAVRRALSKEPAERFRSCQEFVRALHEPKPAAPRQRIWLPMALALLLVLPVLALILLWKWSATPSPTPSLSAGSRQPPPPPPPTPWLPDDFVKSDDATVQPGDGGKQCYSRIEKRFGNNQVIRFVLIPEEPRAQDPRPFYMMDNKVTNGQFKAAWADARFQSRLAKLKELARKFTDLQWEQWRLGGERKINGAFVNFGSDDDMLPVLRVNGLEAYCFARWVDNELGDLPTEDNWDRAAGKYKNAAKQIYRGPPGQAPVGGDTPDVAIMREKQGPLAVSLATWDISVYECRNMAGDGAEWTGTLWDRNKAAATRFLPEQELSMDKQLRLRGMSYTMSTPAVWSDAIWDADGRSFDKDMTGMDGFGFRVAIALPH